MTASKVSSASGADLDLRSPYKGLVPFRTGDAPFFFGRVRDRRIIAANLQSSRLTLLYGASGVGKSSVLNAGVAHHLDRLARDNLLMHQHAGLVVVVFDEWKEPDPVARLAHAIKKSVNELLRADLSANGHTPTAQPAGRLDDVLQWAGKRVGGEVLIILDQFEEFFQVHGRDESPGSFLYEFPRVYGTASLPAHFLLAVREDAWSRLDRFKSSIPNLFDNYYRINHLTVDDARDAIVQPLLVWDSLFGTHTRIENQLVEDVLRDMRVGGAIFEDVGSTAPPLPVLSAPVDDTDGGIETPFLQLVMDRLWDAAVAAAPGGGEHPSVELSLELLNGLGGARQIVRSHLSTLMDALAAEQRELAARVFPLLTASAGKINVATSDLEGAARVGDERRRQLLHGLLDELSGGSARILRPVSPPPDKPDQSGYEIYHDALIVPIRDWQQRYVQERSREEAEQERMLLERKATEERLRLDKERRVAEEAALASRRRTQQVAVVAVAFLVVALLAAFFWYRSFLTLQELQLTKDVLDNRSAALDDANVQLDEGRARVAVKQEAADVANSVARDAQQKADEAQARANEAQARADEAQARADTSQMNADTSQQEADRLQQLVSAQDLAVPQLIKALRHQTAPINKAVFSPSPLHTQAPRVAAAADDGTVWIYDAFSGETLYELKGHTAAVTSIAYSPDGTRLVTASRDKTAIVWDPESGTLIKSVMHPDVVNVATFNHAGTAIVTVSDDGVARLFDADGTLRHELKANTGSLSVAVFSPDDSQLATAGADGVVRVWDPTTAGPPWRTVNARAGAVLAVAYSPDSARLAAVTRDGPVRVWDVASQQILHTLPPQTAAVPALAFSPDGGRLVTALTGDARAGIWDLQTGQLTRLEGHTDSLTSVSFGPGEHSNTILTSSLDGSARLWNLDDGQAQGELRANSGAVNYAEFNAQGDKIVTAHADRTARVWWTASGTGGRVIPLPGHTAAVDSIGYSARAETIVTASADTTARVWNADTGEILSRLVKGHSAAVHRAEFNRDGKLVVTTSADKTARVWQVGSSPTSIMLETQQVLNATFRPTRDQVAVADASGGVDIWDVSVFPARLVAALQGHDGNVNSAEFSPDGERIVTAGDDGTVALWNANDGTLQLALELPAGPEVLAFFSRDGSRFVGLSRGNEVRVWDATTGIELKLVAGRGQLNAVDISGNGKLLATAGADGVARVWNIDTGEEFDLDPTNGVMTWLAFSDDPEGGRLVTASANGTATVWDVASRTKVLDLVGHHLGVTFARFDQSGTRVFTGSMDNTARIWEIPAPAPPQEAEDG